MPPISQCRPPMTPAGPCTAQPEVLRYDSPVVAAGAENLDEYKYVGDSDFYVCAIRVTLDDGLRVAFRNGDGRYLSSSPIVGSLNEYEITLEPPMFIPRGGRIGIELYNATVGDAQFEIDFVGFRKFFVEETMNPYASPAELGLVGDTPQGFRDEPFIYNFDVASIAALTAPGPLPVKIDADADFIWRASGFLAEDGDATAIRLRFTDGLGRYRMNARIPVQMLFQQGYSGATPIFPEIHLPASSVVYFDIENTDGGAITNFQLQMQGVKRSPR